MLLVRIEESEEDLRVGQVSTSHREASSGVREVFQPVDHVHVSGIVLAVRHDSWRDLDRLGLDVLVVSHEMTTLIVSQ